VALLLVPHLAMGGLIVAAAVIGASHVMGFSAWISLPGSYRDDIEISDIPTACGLMLTLSAIGGFVVPVIYGWFMASVGHQGAWVALAAMSIATTLLCFFASTRRLKASQGQAVADA
jgi:hypothetical protein